MERKQDTVGTEAAVHRLLQIVRLLPHLSVPFADRVNPVSCHIARDAAPLQPKDDWDGSLYGISLVNTKRKSKRPRVAYGAGCPVCAFKKRSKKKCPCANSRWGNILDSYSSWQHKQLAINPAQTHTRLREKWMKTVWFPHVHRMAYGTADKVPCCRKRDCKSQDTDSYGFHTGRCSVKQACPICVFRKVRSKKIKGCGCDSDNKAWWSDILKEYPSWLKKELETHPGQKHMHLRKKWVETIWFPYVHGMEFGSTDQVPCCRRRDCIRTDNGKYGFHTSICRKWKTGANSN